MLGGVVPVWTKKVAAQVQRLPEHTALASDPQSLCTVHSEATQVLLDEQIGVAPEQSFVVVVVVVVLWVCLVCLVCLVCVCVMMMMCQRRVMQTLAHTHLRGVPLSPRNHS